MPLIFITPTRRGTVEDTVIGMAEEIQYSLKSLVMQTINAQLPEEHHYPSNDVLVSINNCTIAVPDPELVDYLVTLDVCPGETVEMLSGEIAQAVARVLSEMGLDEGGIEVWGPRPLPGPWCGIKNGKIYDIVNHPKSQLQMVKDEVAA